uniref:Uncharacterized protein n=1 Tax=Heterorhabditis bacteriophora TaxID=37862 RepID=A0A1I7XLT2_HETBA
MEDLVTIKNYHNIHGVEAPGSCRLQKHRNRLPASVARAMNRAKESCRKGGGAQLRHNGMRIWNNTIFSLKT